MIAWPLLTAVYEHSGHRDSYQNLPTLALSRPLLLIPTTSDTPKPLSGSVGYSLPWLDMDLKPTTLHTHGFSCGHPWASLASRGFLPLAAQRPSPHHPNLLSPGESVLGTLFLLFSVYCTSSTLTAFKTTLTLALLIVHVAQVPSVLLGPSKAASASPNPPVFRIFFPLLSVHTNSNSQGPLHPTGPPGSGPGSHRQGVWIVSRR